jgi:hypothetical protein
MGHELDVVRGHEAIKHLDGEMTVGVFDLVKVLDLMRLCGPSPLALKPRSPFLSELGIGKSAHHE